MSGVLDLRYNDCNDTVELHYKGCEEMDNYIHSRLQPKDRTWSKATSCWVVTPDVIEDITYIAEEYFDEIKYFSLPPHLQKKVNKFKRKKSWTKGKVEKAPNLNPFDKLFLKENAPSFLIKAAYKSLAAHYHPDKETGNKEKFIEITEAYKKIKAS
tara:strand:+ start:913 stop:1380 length:468 start_codon:yes stop_codon:yes gene_type:complete